jgi:Prokaryotic E2 family E
LIEAEYGDLEAAPDHSWLIVKRWALPAGWSKTETALLVNIPSGHPVTPPDNFCTDLDLRLANGGTPDSVMGEYEYAGRRWLQFSYHVTDSESDWRPHADILRGHNLLTFLLGVKARLGKAN